MASYSKLYARGFNDANYNTGGFLVPTKGTSQSSLSAGAAFIRTCFLSAPLSAGSIGSGSWTIGIAMQDGGGVSHAANVYIYLINGATGAIRTTIANNLQFGATHNPSTEMTYYGTVSGGAATISVGDYLAVSFNLGSSATPLLYSGGATEITADGASTADAASAITLPSGSSLSFYGAALGISGGTKRREW